MAQGMILNIQHFNLHDGPGVRTLVFFKGCPLRCRWCANPESVNGRPEVGFTAALCVRCGKCSEICPAHAVSCGEDGFPRIDRQECKVCGECVSVCESGALTMYGRDMTAEEVFEQVSRDKLFYDGTNGGVTVTGGEPLQQPRLLLDLFKLCRSAGISTCLETSGWANPKYLEEVLPMTDFFLFDLKHMDSRLHRELTGKPNRRILANAARVASSGVSVLFRMPLIPSVNDNVENVRATAQFLATVSGSNVLGIELMPYHRFGVGKYEVLGLQYTMDTIEPPEDGDLELVREIFEGYGLTCKVAR